MTPTRPSPLWITRGRIISALIGTVWAAIVVGGLVWVAAYDNRPGQGAQAPVFWPSNSGLHRDTSRPTLVMFAHPLCDCTSASLSELGELLMRTSSPLRTLVVFVDPGGLPSDWPNSANLRTARALTGVDVKVDGHGIEAERFGARTSGQVLLYSAAGKLAFSGGITRSRGHGGDSVGRRSILALLQSAQSEASDTPVYGCSLLGPLDVPAVTR